MISKKVKDEVRSAIGNMNGEFVLFENFKKGIAGWHFPREPTNFVQRKFSKSQEFLKNMI